MNNQEDFNNNWKFILPIKLSRFMERNKHMYDVWDIIVAYITVVKFYIYI